MKIAIDCYFNIYMLRNLNTVFSKSHTLSLDTRSACIVIISFSRSVWSEQIYRGFEKYKLSLLSKLPMV